MMAVSARTSGTSCPSSLMRNLWAWTSRLSRARASARALATRARRAFDAVAEYDRLAVLFAGFFSAGLLVCVALVRSGGREGRAWVGAEVAKASAGRPRPIAAFTAAETLTNLKKAQKCIKNSPLGPLKRAAANEDPR